MKRIGIFLLVSVITLSMFGCGRRNDTAPTQTMPATEEATMPSIMPSIDPTIDTNIPDPTVDSNSNQPEDNTEETATDGEASRSSKARMRIR